jgi:hypothetical protein
MVWSEPSTAAFRADVRFAQVAGEGTGPSDSDFSFRYKGEGNPLSNVIFANRHNSFDDL